MAWDGMERRRSDFQLTVPVVKAKSIEKINLLEFLLLSYSSTQQSQHLECDKALKGQKIVVRRRSGGGVEVGG